MFTRTSSLAALILVAGCDAQVRDKVAEAKAEAHNKALENAEGKIECAEPKASGFALACGIDRIQSQDGLYLTLRHPDGGFRRLLVTRDGRGVIAADGAQNAVVTVIGPNQIEVELGGARYRLPATVRQPETAG